MEDGWVGGGESRTHEILKSFLGSPHHQHMLLSSLVHSFLSLLQLLPLCVTIPPTRGVRVLSIVIQAPLRQPFIYSLIHSAGGSKIGHSP